nr:MAG TPA: hypothetical protein [Caudoviricetes sp.]
MSLTFIASTEIQDLISIIPNNLVNIYKSLHS